MAFPYVFVSTFDRGTLADWDSESDTGGLLDVAHYADLSRFPFSECAPFRGAFCGRITLGDTNDHTVTEGDVNIASSSDGWSRFYLNVVQLSTTAQDIFSIYELQSPTSNTQRFVVVLRSDWTSGATRSYQIGVSAGPPGGSTYLTGRLETNRWYCLELDARPANLPNEGDGLGRQDNGQATLYIDAGLTVATSDAVQTGGADASVGQAVLGTQNTLSTTTGLILLDEFVHDDVRIWPLADRFPETVRFVATGHAFVGEGTIDNVTLVSGGATNNRLSIYDTDEASGSDAFNYPVYLRNTANNEIVDPAQMPLRLKRGCYVVLEGTDPQALVKIRRAPHYGSSAVIRQMGRGRTSIKWGG